MKKDPVLNLQTVIRMFPVDSLNFSPDSGILTVSGYGEGFAV
jgi:hypothetical protein